MARCIATGHCCEPRSLAIRSLKMHLLLAVFSKTRGHLVRADVNAACEATFHIRVLARCAVPLLRFRDAIGGKPYNLRWGSLGGPMTLLMDHQIGQDERSQPIWRVQ